MADITRYLFVNHLRTDATAHIRYVRNGQCIRDGAGLAFWFRPGAASLAEIPLDDREQALLFHARTSDFQDVTVQATVSYRVVDPELAATRIDFGIDPDTGRWNTTPLETLGGLLTELAQQPALDQIAEMTMQDALAGGMTPIRERVATALANDERLAERGLTVTDVRVVAIRTDAEIERALQTTTRERVQQDADRATFERRALAVESERAIAENELKNQIELARREEELVGQRGLNARRRAEEEAAAAAIAADGDAARRRVDADATAAARRVVGDAEAHAEAARFEVYGELDQSIQFALVLREIADNLPEINNLTVTPDVVTQAFAQFSRPTIDTDAAA